METMQTSFVRERLETTASKTEVLRIYRVTLRRPDLVDDDGAPITYVTQVALRYPHERAEKRAPLSDAAIREAGRRAVKVERREYGLGQDVPLVFEDVEFVRAKIVQGRI